MLKIKKGDTVKVLSGNDKGKTGEVLEVIPKTEKIIVKGVNIRKKHVKPRKQGEEGIVNTGVFLAPLMLVAGDHANNDMAGDDESFATILKANGYTPQCVIKGIGEYPAVRQVYLSHLQKAVKALENVSDTDNLPDKKSGILYGIGVGTGNPKQMTLQELEVIKSCDLIVIPAALEG